MSADLPEGSVVLACQNCNLVTIEGSGQWVKLGPGFRDALRLSAGTVKQERDTVKAIMETDISDPRWTDISTDFLR